MTFCRTVGKRKTKRSPGRALPLALFCVVGILGCEDSDPTFVEETHRAAEDHGFNVGQLFHALDLAEASGTVEGLVVERHGIVVGEAYAPEVPHWSLFETWTVTEAVTSLVVGAALEAGYLESLDQTLGNLLVPWDQHMDEAKAGITIRQLLTMTSGVSRPERTTEEYLEWMAADDQVAWVLNHPLLSMPGERFRSDVAPVHLLSAAITQATGESMAELAREIILDPLQIGWADWLVDSNGINFGGFGLRIRTRDLVKFARLVLDQGEWKGTEILPSDWIEEATRPHVHPFPDYPEWGFGYLWKSTTFAGHPIIYASGYGAQILVAVPELDLAIALNGGYPADDEAAVLQNDTAWDIISQIIRSAR